jgi:glycosyltransferase involved in cell wall biosynthesis
MEKISLVIITFNEEKNIRQCLSSAFDIVDEIIVVDSFSTDKTEEICSQFDVKFVKHKFEGHIEQKNWALTQAKYPIILSLDADEVLSDELKNSILSVKNNSEYEGYFFNRKTNYCGKWINHTGWYPDQKLRLWKAGQGNWTGMNPHDKFELIPGATKKFLKGDLLHYSYHSISQHIQQVDKFTDIIALANFNKGKRTNLLKAIFHSIWKFKHDYILKLGFLDGYYGFVISIISAFATFSKNIKLIELYRNKKMN